MTPFPNDHDHNARAMTVLRGRNIQVVQRGSKIRVTGIRAEEAEALARHRKNDRPTAYDIVVSALIITGAILFAAYQMDAILARAIV